MLSAFAILCALPTPEVTEPVWAVTEFRSVKPPGYGRMVADVLSEELAQWAGRRVVDPEATRSAQKHLGLEAPPVDKQDFWRLAERLKASDVVEGDVLDHQIRQISGGWQACVALRVVAFDPFSGFPVNGALEEGESTLRATRLPDAALVREALAQASLLAVHAMRTRHIAEARVSSTAKRVVTINRRTLEGFKTGMRVLFSRGPIRTAMGHVVAVEVDQAQVEPEGSVLAMAPGDRARATYEPPVPPPGDFPFPTKQRSAHRGRDGWGRRT